MVAHPFIFVLGPVYTIPTPTPPASFPFNICSYLPRLNFGHMTELYIGLECQTDIVHKCIINVGNGFWLVNPC